MSLHVLDLVGAGMLSILFIAVTGFAELFTRRGKLDPELARKSVHLAGGLGCLLIPFLIHSWITVLCLALFFAAVFYAGERRGLLRSLSSVKRDSVGSLLFPVSVLLLFVVSGERLWLYIAGLLILVLADTAAALAGTHLGRRFYRTAPGEQKSLEGTVSFFAVGFFCVFFPLLGLSGYTTLTCLLTALLMAILLAGFEAISIGGTDNLFVPVATCYLLLKVPEKAPEEILFQCLSLLLLAVMVSVLNRRVATLHTRLLIMFIMITFAAWSLGSVEWMIPLVSSFVIYNVLCRGCQPLSQAFTARELLRPQYPLLFILFTANYFMEHDRFFGPFLVSATVAISLCIVNRYRKEAVPIRMHGIKLLAAALLPSLLSLLCCLPFQGMCIVEAAPAVLLISLACTLLYNRYAPLPLTVFAWNYLIPILSAFAALLYAVLQYFGYATQFDPFIWRDVF